MHKTISVYSFGAILLPKVYLHSFLYMCMHCMWLRQLPVVHKFNIALHMPVA